MIPTGRRPAGAIVGMMGVLAIAVSGCRTGEANEAGSGLTVATASRMEIVSSVEATGTIEPIRVIEIKSQASGEVLELPVELGDRVRKGDLLVRIDPRDVRNAHEQAEADLEVAQARLQVAERQLARTRALRDSAVVTEDELEAAILEHANARAALVKAQTNLELARDRLEDVTLRAPISGTVVERSVEEGQIITGAREVTGGTLLMRMADLAEVQVRTLVDETDIGRVRPGLPASITVEAFPERNFTGAVLKIEPQAVVEQNVTMFAVLTRIVNEDDLLRPGMNADVQIVIGREEDVLGLPNAAIKTPQEARQLARALGLDAEVPTARPGGVGRPGADGGSGGGTTGSAGDPAADAEARMGSMSPEERRRYLQSLPAEERQRLFARMRERAEAAARGDRANPARPRPAVVFLREPGTGELRMRPITIGLGNFEHTQVLEGLEEGDQVLEIPQSLVQQRELLERVRGRSGVPGVSRN